MSTFSRASFVFFFAFTMHACGGASAASTRPSAPRATEVTFDRWYVVLERSGPGLAPGSGVRFRASGFEVASGERGQAMGGTCATGAEGIDCEGFGGTLSVRRRPDGANVATQGPIELVLGDADAEQSARWSDAVERESRRTASCRVTADCCVAVSNAVQGECDLERYLGDRTEQSCSAGLETLRTELAASGRQTPAECR